MPGPIGPKGMSIQGPTGPKGDRGKFELAALEKYCRSNRCSTFMGFCTAAVWLQI